MTRTEREKLIDAMCLAYRLGVGPLRVAMGRALAVAEPVVREDEAKVLDARVAEIRADQAYWGGPDTTNGAVLIPELEARAAAIRARGAAGEAADDGR